MKQLVFREVAPDAAQQVLAAIAPEIRPAALAFDQTWVQAADLPFYEDVKLYAVSDLRLPSHNVYHALHGPGLLSLLDGSKEPVYRVNSLAPVRLDPDTLAPYARFLLHYLKGPMGGFIIAEELEDIPWLPEATDEEMAAAAAHLMPVTHKGVDDDGLFTLTATVVFRNALFRTDIKVTPREMDVIDPESGASQHLAAGEVRLVNEEPLMEDLSVAWTSPADEDEESLGLDGLDELDEDGDEVEGLNESDEEPEEQENQAHSQFPFQVYEGLPRIDGLVFRDLTSDEAHDFLAALPPEIFAALPSPDRTWMEAADLPFYDAFKLYALTDQTAPPPNVRFMLHEPGCAVPMNCTNEPIYTVNEIAPVKLTPETLGIYAKLFFFLVRGQLGRFIIVEKPEDVAWLPVATDQEKADLASRLMPLTYGGIDPDGLHTLTGTVIFKNALFRTDIKVAPREMDAPDPETGEMEHFSVGQLKLANEDLLLEDLNVPIPPPPGKAG